MRIVFVVMLRSCLSCGTLKFTWMEPCLPLEATWLTFQFALALAFLGSCWCFASGLGIRCGHVPDQALTSKHVMKQV